MVTQSHPEFIKIAQHLKVCPFKLDFLKYGFVCFSFTQIFYFYHLRSLVVLYPAGKEVAPAHVKAACEGAGGHYA